MSFTDQLDYLRQLRLVMGQVTTEAEQAEGAIRSVQTSATDLAAELEPVSDANRALDEILSKQGEIDQEMDRIRQKIETINQEIRRLEGQDGTGEQVGLLKRERGALYEQLERKAIESRDLAGRKEFLESAAGEREFSVDESDQAGGGKPRLNLYMKGVAVAMRREVEAEFEGAKRKLVDDVAEGIGRELSRGEQLLDKFRDNSLIFTQVEELLRLFEQERQGTTGTSLGIQRLLEFITFFGGRDGASLAAYLRTLRGGGDREGRDLGARSSSAPGEQSTDLSTAVAQGKMKLGW